MKYLERLSEILKEHGVGEHLYPEKIAQAIADLDWWTSVKDGLPEKPDDIDSRNYLLEGNFVDEKLILESWRGFQYYLRTCPGTVLRWQEI